jgi:hypothetical protein
MRRPYRQCMPRVLEGARVKRAPLLLSAYCFLAVVGCAPYYYDRPVTTDGTVTLKTYGDMGTATSRARLACGEPKRTPVLMGLSGTGPDQMATFGCQ